MPTYEDLLYVDFDGNSVDDSEEVILEGLDDDRRLDRTGRLEVAVMDTRANPEIRLLALVALTTWGEESGFRYTAEAAGSPESVPWLGVSVDRFFSVDNTFAQLASAVVLSREIAEENGTDAARNRAILALIDIADQVYFDGQIEQVVSGGPPGEVSAAALRAVGRGLEMLRTGSSLPFDLATQLIDVLVPIAAIDESAAVSYASSILENAPSPRAIVHAADIVGSGHGPETTSFADHLAALGGESVRSALDRAFRQRALATSGNANNQT